MDLRKIDWISELIFELLGNISKRWEHFTNLLSGSKFFPWKAKIFPQKRKFVHFFFIFFRLDWEINQFFPINWIFFFDQISSSVSKIFPTISLEKFTIHLYLKLSDYFRKNFRTKFYSVLAQRIHKPNTYNNTPLHV